MDIEWTPEAIEDAEALPPDAKAELQRVIELMRNGGLEAVVEQSTELTEEEWAALHERIKARRAVRRN